MHKKTIALERTVQGNVAQERTLPDINRHAEDRLTSNSSQTHTRKAQSSYRGTKNCLWVVALVLIPVF